MSRAILACLFLVTFASGAVAAGDSVKGTYRVNGIDAKLAFSLAHKSNPFFDKPTVRLVFSAKDASGDANPDSHARDGAFGDALVLTLFKDDLGWDVLAGDLFHSGIKDDHKVGFGSPGFVHAKDLSFASGRISGHLVTDQGEKVGNNALDLNLTFDVKQP